MGRRRSAYRARRLFGQFLLLEDDAVERHDICGRRLADVYLHGRNLEAELLREGDARLLVIEPNHADAHAMLDEELTPPPRRVKLRGALQSLIRASASSMPVTEGGVRHGWS